jgi:hypothetical protein
VPGPATPAGLAHGGGHWQEPEWEDEGPQERHDEAGTPPRRGFFARLFRRRPTRAPAELEWEQEEVASEPHPDSEPDALVSDEDSGSAESASGTEPAGAQAAPDLEPAPSAVSADDPPAEAEETADDAAELEAQEQTAAEEVTAVLTSMLDRLGTAHHRPFSRA